VVAVEGRDSKKHGENVVMVLHVFGNVDRKKLKYFGGDGDLLLTNVCF